MALDFEALVAQVKQLPREQRERLADEITNSLQRESTLDSALARRGGPPSTREELLAQARPFRPRRHEALMDGEEHERFLEWLDRQRHDARHADEQRLDELRKLWEEGAG